jgi:hypothetical protein
VLVANQDNSCHRLNEVEELCERLQVPVKQLVLRIE